MSRRMGLPVPPPRPAPPERAVSASFGQSLFGGLGAQKMGLPGGLRPGKAVSGGMGLLSFAEAVLFFEERLFSEPDAPASPLFFFL